MKKASAAVADAGPLIHLDELDWLFVLENLIKRTPPTKLLAFKTLAIATRVISELPKDT